MSEKDGFVIEDGFLKKYDPWKSSKTNVTVPSGVIIIGRRAFEECKSIKSVILPDGLKFIERGAFRNCECLEEINLPEGLEVIENDAFYGCYSLKKIVIPASIKQIMPGAFFLCWDLKKVKLKEGIECIDSSAFMMCGLSEINMPNSVMAIGNDAFYDCRIKEITIPSGVRRIEHSTFSNCHKLKSVTFSEGLEIVADMAFDNCDKLQDIALPEGLISIGKEAFRTSKKIKTQSIKLPSTLQSIGEDAFANREFECIHLPKGIKHVNRRALGKGTPYIVCYSADIANAMENAYPIYLGGEVKDLDLKTRNHATKGFVYAVMNEMEEIMPYRAGYVNLIRTRKDHYIDYAYENKPFCYFMIQENLLAKDQVETLLEIDMVKEDAVLKAELLRYQNERFGHEGVEELSLDEKTTKPTIH